MKTFLLLLLLFPFPVFAKPVPATLVVIDETGVNIADIETLTDSAIGLLPNKTVFRSQTVVMVGNLSVNSAAGWKPILCPSLGKRGELLVIVQPRGYTIGFSPGICTVWNKCSAVHVNIDLADPRAAIIAIAHEIAHALGAVHDTKCSLMSPKAITSCGKRGTKISQESKNQVRSCLQKGAR